MIDDNKNYKNYRFIDQLKRYEKNCRDICITFDLKKYIIEKNLCFDNCQAIGEYKFEYNNICYKDYPFYINTSDIASDTIEFKRINLETSDTTELNNLPLEKIDLTEFKSII